MSHSITIKTAKGSRCQTTTSIEELTSVSIAVRGAHIEIEPDYADCVLRVFNAGPFGQGKELIGKLPIRGS